MAGEIGDRFHALHVKNANHLVQRASAEQHTVRLELTTRDT
jgi:hypothetical protein